MKPLFCDKALHAIVHGRVQGVAFRRHTLEEASRLGLHGYVQNLPDGTVETFFQGESRAVDILADWLRQGPDRARVDQVDLEPAAPTGSFTGFTIAR